MKQQFQEIKDNGAQETENKGSKHFDGLRLLPWESFQLQFREGKPRQNPVTTLSWREES